MSFLKSLLMMLCVISFAAIGQSKIKTKDSVDIKTRIEGFYSWYADQIKNSRDDYSPSFKKRDDGMTTLDFKKYGDGLRNHGFTDNFIKRKIKSYKTCVDNLSKIKYETFLKFDGLDDYEDIKCAFGNVREWTRDQERHDGADLIRLKLINNRTIAGTVHFYTLNPDGTKSIWDFKQAVFTFILQGNDWRIDNFKMEWLKI